MSQYSEIHFTRALEQFEFEGAFRCIYHSYCRRGLISSNSFRQLRVIRHHLLPETRVFVARIGRQVVGTLSLVEDRPLGVPMRSVFDEQVDELALANPRIAEASCLAVDDARASGLFVVHHLMGLAAQAASRRGISRILIAVHPRHASFYERAAGFRKFAAAAPYPSVQGSPAVGLQLNLSTLRMDCPQAWHRYFGMRFSHIALSTRNATPHLVRRMARLWQSIHGHESETVQRLEIRPYILSAQERVLAAERRFIDGRAHVSNTGLSDRRECAAG